jgi:ADP-ribose pyrophosphatase
MANVYSGRVFSVEVTRKRFPDGSEHEVEVVRHRPSVVLIPVNPDGTLVLVRQFRASVDRELWELPAGGVKPGETADAAAARECEEEIGLRPATIVRLQGLYPAPGFCDEELIFFRVSDLQPPPPDSPHRPDDDENIQTRSYAVEEVSAMVARGEIVDLKTAYGVTLAGAREA